MSLMRTAVDGYKETFNLGGTWYVTLLATVKRHTNERFKVNTKLFFEGYYEAIILTPTKGLRQHI